MSDRLSLLADVATWMSFFEWLLEAGTGGIQGRKAHVQNSSLCRNTSDSFSITEVQTENEEYTEPFEVCVFDRDDIVNG